MATVVAGTLAAALHGVGCQPQQNIVAVRSLSQSGKFSFVCLDRPDMADAGLQVRHPLSDCNAAQVSNTWDYLPQDDAGNVVTDAGADLYHLYALVTQTARGEVAVVDTTAWAASVLDENPLQPGANFLPVGAQPTGIVSMSGSTATFVGVAEPGREGLFVLPSDKIRSFASIASDGEYVDSGTNYNFGAGGNWGQHQPVYSLTKWTACSLPGAPGEMLLVVDPPDAVTPPGANPNDACYADRSGGARGDYSTEPLGRQKLVVTIPSLHGIAILDAYKLLEWELPNADGGAGSHAAGSFDACPVERWIPLSVNLSGLSTQNPQPTSLGCGNAPATTLPLACGVSAYGFAGAAGSSSSGSSSSGGSTSSSGSSSAGGVPSNGGPYSLASCACRAGNSLTDGCYPATPAGIAYAEGKLYVADSTAPIIHVIDMPTPCEPLEVAPLLPTSAEAPTRVVTSRHVAISPTATPDLKRYLYASDIDDASLMVFDVSSTSTTRRPLLRNHPEWNPFEPRDRIRFSSPIADVVVAHHDVPSFAPATGVAAEGVLCSPGPQLCVATTGNNYTCDVGTLYRPNTTTYTQGAGPSVLRGDFAFAALTSGKLAVIDINDFDAPCRIPLPSDSLPHPELGCPNPIPSFKEADGKTLTNYGSQEISCNIVMPNTPRSAYYEANNQASGEHVPEIAAAPQLYQQRGTQVPATNRAVPRMLAGLGTGDIAAAQTIISNQQTTYAWPGAGANGSATNACTSFGLALNLEDPRAHILDQNWTVTFEGALPNFTPRLVTMTVDAIDANVGHVVDPNSRFCDNGVLGSKAFDDMRSGGMIPAEATSIGDYVQITTELLDPQDGYWAAFANPVGVTYDMCYEYFGTAQPTELDTRRDLAIVEAYNDHLDVTPRNPPKGYDTRGDAGKGVELTAMQFLATCFPSKNTFTVRAGNAWVVWGDQTGFLHHVISSDSTGQCRNACDPLLARKNGRVLQVPTSVRVPMPDDQAKLWEFVNPSFRFGIVAGHAVSDACKVGASVTALDPERDMQFRFQSSGSFVPMQLALSYDGTSLISPVSVRYVGPTKEVVVSDGNLNGLIFVSLTSAAWSRSFY